MTKHEAWLYAASWGSYIRNGDPGACMYGFDENFKVQSEEHRADCKAHMEKAREMVLANPENYDEDEVEKIEEFLIALKEAECWPESADLVK